MPVIYILSNVWVRLSIFSPLSIIQYVGLYVFSLPISLMMIERIYILCLFIIIKSQVWTITHCLELGHETMVSTVCLSIFLHIRDATLVETVPTNVSTYSGERLWPQWVQSLYGNRITLCWTDDFILNSRWDMTRNTGTWKKLLYQDCNLITATPDM